MQRDVAFAVSYIKQNGVSQIFLVGASIGANTVIISSFQLLTESY